jgi:hypothetical protein
MDVLLLVIGLTVGLSSWEMPPWRGGLVKSLARVKISRNFSFFFLIGERAGGTGGRPTKSFLHRLGPRLERSPMRAFSEETAMPTSRPLPILEPDRLRRPPRSFAWLDHRLRSEGFLARMTAEELGLYCFLTLAADAQGLSCWRLDRIERALPFDTGSLHRARDGLIRAGLLAFRPWHANALNGSYQVLSLPASIPAPRGCASLAALLPDLGALPR